MLQSSNSITAKSARPHAQDLVADGPRKWRLSSALGREMVLARVPSHQQAGVFLDNDAHEPLARCGFLDRGSRVITHLWQDVRLATDSPRLEGVVSNATTSSP